MTNRKSFKKKVKLNVRIMNFIRAILLRQMVQFLFFGRTRGMPPRKSHDLDWYQIQIDHCNYAIYICYYVPAVTFVIKEQDIV